MKGRSELFDIYLYDHFIFWGDGNLVATDDLNGLTIPLLVLFRGPENRVQPR